METTPRSEDEEANDAIKARVASIVAETRATATSDDPLVQIAWIIFGLDMWHRTNGNMGHSPDLTVEYVTSRVLRLLARQEGKDV